MLLIGILLLSLVGCSWVFIGVLMGRVPKLGVDAEALITANSIVGSIISIIVLLFTGRGEADIKGIVVALLLMFTSGVLNSRQLVYMSRAMQCGPNGIIWSLLQCGFIIPFLAGVIFYGVPLNPFRISAIVSLVLALLALGLVKDRKNASGKVSGEWRRLTLLAFLFTGVTQLFANLPSYYEELQKVSSVWRTLAVYQGLIWGTPIFALLNGKWRTMLPLFKEQMRKPALWKMCILWQCVSITVSYFLIYKGMDILGNCNAGAISYPIMVGTCIVMFQFYDILVLKAKTTPMQLAGLALCLYGVVAICL